MNAYLRGFFVVFVDIENPLFIRDDAIATYVFGQYSEGSYACHSCRNRELCPFIAIIFNIYMYLSLLENVLNLFYLENILNTRGILGIYTYTLLMYWLAHCLFVVLHHAC